MVEQSGIRIVSMLEQRVSMLMFFKFRNEMKRGDLILERQSAVLKEMRKWSLTWRSSAVQLEGVRPEQQIRSRVCPFVCVGKLMN